MKQYESDQLRVERRVAAQRARERDERLERIATAAMVPGLAAVMRSPDIMAALLQAAGEKGTTLPEMVAVDAVAFAKALIAELDKQA